MIENRAFSILFITKKKKKGFAWKFFETLIQNVQSHVNLLFQRTLFLMFPLF